MHGPRRRPPRESGLRHHHGRRCGPRAGHALATIAVVSQELERTVRNPARVRSGRVWPRRGPHPHGAGAVPLHPEPPLRRGRAAARRSTRRAERVDDVARGRRPGRSARGAAIADPCLDRAQRRRPAPAPRRRSSRSPRTSVNALEAGDGGVDFRFAVSAGGVQIVAQRSRGRHEPRRAQARRGTRSSPPSRRAPARPGRLHRAAP